MSSTSVIRRAALVLPGLRRLGAEPGALWGVSRLHAAAPTAEAASTSGTSDPGSGAAEEVEDVAAIEAYRAAKNFRRRADGRVLLFGRDSGGWVEAKLDGYVEGSLLLLSPDGGVHYLVSEDLKQIDLSSDQLVGTLFGEGSWERIMQPLYSQNPDGDLKHVRMSPQQFRSIFTVLREGPAPGGMGGGRGGPGQQQAQ